MDFSGRESQEREEFYSNVKFKDDLKNMEQSADKVQGNVVYDGNTVQGNVGQQEQGESTTGEMVQR